MCQPIITDYTLVQDRSRVAYALAKVDAVVPETLREAAIYKVDYIISGMSSSGDFEVMECYPCADKPFLVAITKLTSEQIDAAQRYTHLELRDVLELCAD